MDALTEAQQIDLALVRWHAAARYMRKRRALRKAIKLGLFEGPDIRRCRAEVVNIKCTWRAARALLSGRV